MDKKAEIQCLANIALGDQKAFKDLFMAYFPKVKYFITHLVKTEADAEDLTQDIFEKIWIARESLFAIDSFNSYIYRMAKNAVLNSFKKDEYHTAYIEHSLQNKNNEAPIEEILYAQEIELLIKLTVERMPAQRKKVYEMSRIEGLKNDEIAIFLKITKRTVEAHLNLALNEIRKTISSFFIFFF